MAQQPPSEKPEPARLVERDPMNALIRRERAIRRLPSGAACVQCGETNPLLLEVHHVAGIANAPDESVVLCLNHHRLQSADQRAVGVDLDSRHDRTLLDRAVAWLRGLALLFSDLSSSCREMADRLAMFARALDANFKAWRTMPEANEATPRTSRSQSEPGLSEPASSTKTAEPRSGSLPPGGTRRTG